MRSGLRRLFPGANTSRGFVSRFEFIPPPRDSYVFILKGGPGTGKSTFMQRLAAEGLAFGLDVEFHHCSADPESVDGIAFPALGAAVVDGTAPHVVEPSDYEVGGEIVDLGTFCDRISLQRQRRRIEGLREEARSAFARAYRYLAAAREVREAAGAATRSGRGGAPDGAEHRRAVQTMLHAVFEADVPHQAEPPRWPAGWRRRLFAGGITPDGPRHHLDTLLAPLERRFIVEGGFGTDRSAIIEAAADAAAARGLSVELFHCAFEPEKLDHVIIPALATGIFSSVPPHVVPDAEPTSVLRLGSRPDERTGWADPEEGQSGPGAEAQETFWQLFRRGVAALQEAKAAHMELERCYAPHVDFDGVERLRRQIGDRLFQRPPGPPGKGAAAFVSL